MRMPYLYDYIKDVKRRNALAEAINYSPDYIWQVATNRRRASIDLANSIADYTKKKVPRSSIRPDIWGEEAA